MFLSKSDFKVARTCPTKLYYRKLGYPRTNDDDPYLEFLADGGYMVEAIAKLMFPEGREIIGDSVEARVSATKQALEKQDVTLFGATLLHGRLIAEVDILEKHGNQFRLIEVKAKSVEPQADGSSPFRGKRGGINAKWRPYLEDVAFQTLILLSLVPEAEVIPNLCIVDKTQTSNAETSFENFEITPRPKDGQGRFQRPTIAFAGDVDVMRDQPFVGIFDVTSEVETLASAVEKSAARFAAALAGDKPVRLEPTLGSVCKKCEYRVDHAEQSGFRECWKHLADPSPHVLDLYRVDRLGGPVFANMVAREKSALVDIPRGALKGKIGDRQKLQLKWTKAKKEFIDPKLPKILARYKYPLHFVDFEAARLAVPYHAGMRPYGLVAFQWSCHTIPEPDADLQHREWINVEDEYPNFKFASRLKDVVKGDGTIFVWSSFERTVLKDIRDRMPWYNGDDVALSDWLNRIIDEEGPLVDLYELAKSYYFHPDMAGSVSIKKVLPAIWFNHPSLRSHQWFSRYLKEIDGQVLDPYKTLPALAFQSDNMDDDNAVREGTAAVRTYQDMMYGEHRANPRFRQNMKQLLLNYCRLDTAAMVMIWMHWLTKT